jgi:hypothetical protein
VKAAALLAVVLGFAAAGCGGGGKTAATTTVVTTTTPATVTTHGRFHYPPVLISSYMASCTTGGVARQAYCACTLDKLSNNVSVKDFSRVGLSGGSLSRRMQRLINKAAADCKSKL